jgi:sugar phosphate isomerase/epimerase
MKKHHVAVQLYSLREEVKKIGFIEVLKKVVEYGYPGVEFAGLYGKKPKEIRKIIDDLGLKGCSTHGEFPALENLPQIVDAAKTLGYQCHVTGLGHKQWSTEDECKKTAEKLQASAAALKKNSYLINNGFGTRI